MISKIHIQGYKSLKDVEVELGELNVLIGANGSGKSNFLNFFNFLLAIRREGLGLEVAKGGGVNSFLHYGRKTTKELKWDILFSREEFEYKAALTPSNGEYFVFASEVANMMGADYKLGAGHKESKIRAQTNEIGNLSLAIVIDLDGIATYHFHDTSVNSPLNQPSSTDLKHLRLRQHGENIAGFLYTLKAHAPKRYKLLLKTVASIAPYFLEFRWQELGQQKQSLTWVSRYSDEVFRFTDFSDGTQRFIALCCVFLQEDLPDTIVIDEPELGLHPTAIAKLVGLMRSAVGRGAQVITATQSTDFVDYFQPEEILTADQQMGVTQLHRLSAPDWKKWLEDYSLGDLWSQGIIDRAQVSRSDG